MVEIFKNTLSSLYTFDIVYLVFTLLSLIKCTKNGFVLSILSASKWLLAYVITLFLFPKAKPYLKDYNKTIKYCHSTVGVAILNTSITIVFGFSILILSNFIPTIYFGVFTGIAMLLAMVSVLTLLPSLLLVFKPFKIK